MESPILKLVQMDIFMFYLTQVKFSEFPVKDEEKSDRIFKNLLVNIRFKIAQMFEHWRDLYP